MDLSALKTRLLLKPHLAFYASIMFQLDIDLDDSIETACTNGKYIKFNETFMDKHPVTEQLGVLVHEILHVAYLHMFRGEHLDKQKFNVACDYHINDFILHTLKLELPACRLYDAQYAGMSSEEIYHLLPDDNTKPDYDDLAPCINGEGGPEKGGTTPKVMEAEVQGIVQQAAVEASIQKQAGSIPADILRRIDEEINPLLPWQTILARYAQEKSQDDYSWSRRNLYYPSHYLPSLYSETIGTIGIYVDCSGSVSNDELAQYCSEVRQIMSELNPTETTVVSFSHHITNIQVIEQDEEVPIEIKGMGGTCLTEVAEMINDREDAVSIVFTDGHYTPVTYNKPVLHIIINNKAYINNDHEVIHAVI